MHALWLLASVSETQPAVLDQERTMLISHLSTGRRDRLNLLRGKLYCLDRVLQHHHHANHLTKRLGAWIAHRRGGNATATHDLDEVRATPQLFSRRLQDLRDAVACAAERSRLPRTAARIRIRTAARCRLKIGMSTYRRDIGLVSIDGN